MRGSVAGVLLLLAASTEAFVQLGCVSHGPIEVCLKVDASLNDTIDGCVRNGYTPDATGSVDVSASVKGFTFLTTPLAEAKVTCDSAVSSVSIAAGASVLGQISALPFEDSIIDMRFRLEEIVNSTALSLDWAGSLLGGDISLATSDVLRVGFSMDKVLGSAGLGTSLFVDIDDNDSDSQLSLPSRLTFLSAGYPLFDQAQFTVPDSCPFNLVTDHPGLSIPNLAAFLQVQSAMFDVCTFVSDNKTGEPFFQIVAGTAAPLSLLGMSVESASVDLTGTQSTNGGQIMWSGVFSGAVDAFGATVSGSARFSASAMDSVQLAINVNKPALVLSGVANIVSEGCSADNNGTVSLKLPGAGNFSVEGVIAQQDACGADGKPLWEVDIFSPKLLEVSGVSVSDVEVTLASYVNAANETKWGGDIKGTVNLGSGNSATAHVVFNEDEGVQSFSVDGNVQIGPVGGHVSFSVADSIMTGTANLTVANTDPASANLVPTFTASVTHVSTFTTDNSHLPLWSIDGALSSVEVHGFTLETVAVTLRGAMSNPDNVGDAPKLEWTGSVAGSASFAGADVHLTATLENNEFTSLVGDLYVTGTGVVFNGTIEVTADNAANRCAAIAGTGSLDLTSSGHNFDASVLFNQCAVKAGETRFAMTATAAGMAYEQLALTRVAMALRGDVAVNGTDDLTWAGNLNASANLFGGSAQAHVAFADGELQKVGLHTKFMTSNGLMSSTLDVEYVNSCVLPSKGSADLKLRLGGAADLNIGTTLDYYKCNGAMDLHGSLATSWDGPGGMKFVDVALELHAGGHGGAAMLSTRTWTGVINATTSNGLTVQIEFNSSSTDSSVEATIMYEDDNVRMVTTVRDDCTGEGQLYLKNLPHQIPAVEIDVSLAKPCDDASRGSKAWTVSGSVENLVIPFFGKTLVVDRVAVSVASDAAGKKSVVIAGDFLDQFSADLSFGVPVVASEVVLRASLKAAGAATPDSFAVAWQGSGSGSPMSSSMGVGSPALFAGLKGLSLTDVALKVTFDGKLSLTAGGGLFGLRYDVLIAIVKQTSGWNFGFAFTASGSLATDGMPAVVANVLDQLAPTWVRFSLAKAAMEVEGIKLRHGLSLAAFMGSDSGIMTSVRDLCPADLNKQIESATVGGGLTIVADIKSVTEINVFVILAGEIPLGSKAMLREVALAFVLKTGPPEIGFNILLDFTVGKGVQEQTFTAGGFISLSATGSLTVALSMDSDKPWSNPFGVQGVKVLFPLGIKMTITPALLPSGFALIGGLQIGGTSGSVVVGVDLQDFTKCAMSAEINNFDFKSIVTDIAQCDDCLGPVAGVLTDVSVERFAASFNPNPVSDVAITIAGVSAVIPAGISVELVNLKIWKVIHIVEAKFKVNAKGLEVSMSAAPIRWGNVLEITSADGSTGPSLELTLTSQKQLLKIDGRAKLLGQTVSLYLILSDERVYGKFTYSLGSLLSVEVTMDTVGKPGDADFSNTITGRLEVDIIAKVVDYAVDFLLKLSEKATAGLKAANAKLESAKSGLDRAEKKLLDAERAALGKISGAQNSLNAKASSMNSKYRSCKSKEARCRSKWWTCGSVPFCWIGYGVTKAAYKIAWGVLEVAKGFVMAGTRIAQGGLRIAKGVLSAAQGVVNAALVVVGAFADIVKAVGGVLRNVLRIHSLVFSNTLTSSSNTVAMSGDLTVVGFRFQFDFSCELNFKSFAKAIYSMFRNRMKSNYGNKIADI